MKLLKEEGPQARKNRFDLIWINCQWKDADLIIILFLSIRTIHLDNCVLNMCQYVFPINLSTENNNLLDRKTLFPSPLKEICYSVYCVSILKRYTIKMEEFYCGKEVRLNSRVVERGTEAWQDNPSPQPTSPNLRNLASCWLTAWRLPLHYRSTNGSLSHRKMSVQKARTASEIGGQSLPSLINIRRWPWWNPLPPISLTSVVVPNFDKNSARHYFKMTI